MREIISQAKKLFTQDPNLIRAEGNVVIIGDIHGQFMDMMNMFAELRREPRQNNGKFVFLGDYVDRGEFGCEVMGYLLALKLQYPKYVFMLRGNHETEEMTTDFNFRTQVLDRFDEDIYQEFLDLFDSLPLGCVVNNKLLCVHGGIS